MRVLQKVSPNTLGCLGRWGPLLPAPASRDISLALPPTPGFFVCGVKPCVISAQGGKRKQPWDSLTPKSSALLHSCRAARRVSKQEEAGLCLLGETIKGSTMLLKLTRGTKT